MMKVRHFQPYLARLHLTVILLACMPALGGQQPINVIPTNQPPLAKIFRPASSEQTPSGTGKFVIFTREDLNKTGKWDFIACAWECIPSQPSVPITKRLEFCHSSWDAWPLLGSLVDDERSKGQYPRFVRLQVDAGNRDYSVNLYDINYRTWEARCVWQGSRLTAFGALKATLVCRSANGWFSLDALTGTVRREVPCIPLEADGNYWIVRKTGETSGNWSYNPVREEFVGHFRDIERPRVGCSRSFVTPDGRSRAWILAPMPDEWRGGSLKGAFVLQRDGHTEDTWRPITFQARLGSGVPVIPTGITFQCVPGGKVEFAAQIEKPGTTERVWTIDIASGNISEAVRPHRAPPEPGFVTFDGVPAPDYLRPYLKNLRHFGRGGLAPAFLMHMGVLKKQPEFPDCEAGVSNDGRHIFYKAKRDRFRKPSSTGIHKLKTSCAGKLRRLSNPRIPWNLFGSRRHEAPESRCKTILTRPKLPVGLTGSISVPPGPEERSLLLPMQPLEEFLETSVRQDCCHRTEGVPKLVMTPSLVDKILTGVARRHDLGSAFAARHHVMSTRRDLPFTERARIGHRIFI